MDINATSTSLYGQYQNLIDRFKSGEVDYMQALDEHQALAPKTRELIDTGAIAGTLEGAPVRVDIPVQVVADIEAYLAARESGQTSAHRHAASTYQNGTPQASPKDAQEDAHEATLTWLSKQAIIGGTPVSIADKMPKLDPGFMQSIRSAYNGQAREPLIEYAMNNKDEWVAAANKFGIPVSEQRFFVSVNQQTHNQPFDIRGSIRMDEDNSQAERIFRHIASADEVAAFDAHMASTQKELQGRVNAKSMDHIVGTHKALMDFAPHRAVLKSAGLTAEDMAGVMLTRSPDGLYGVTSQNDKAATIETAINTNPDLRAMYDAGW